MRRRGALIVIAALAAAGCLDVPGAGGDGDGDDDAGCDPETCAAVGGACTCDRCAVPDATCAEAAQRYDDGDRECVPVVVDVDVGFRHACVVWSDGGASCWGRDCDGQLGDAPTTTCEDDETRALLPVAVLDADGRTPLGGVDELALGQAHSCARRDDTVWCWGDDARGQLGDGGGAAASAVPVQVLRQDGEPLTGVAQLASGALHVCALDADGVIWCWGDNKNLQTGEPDPEVETVVAARALDLPAPMRRIRAGGKHTCAVDADHTVWCWGKGDSGQLGDGDADRVDHATPVQVIDSTLAVLGPIGALAGGGGLLGGFSCAAHRTGEGLWCWGENAEHQLGDSTDATTPGVSSTTAVAGLLDDVVITQLDAGGAFACARSAVDTVYCWGANGLGQLGDVDATAIGPREVLGGAVTMSSGSASSCALTSDGRVLCWGDNTDGQLGDGSVVARAEPMPVAELCR
jgi:alpha-tubulin suppressor-like RCC1 family protein